MARSDRPFGSRRSRAPSIRPWNVPPVGSPAAVSAGVSEKVPLTDGLSCYRRWRSATNAVVLDERQVGEALSTLMERVGVEVVKVDGRFVARGLFVKSCSGEVAA